MCGTPLGILPLKPRNCCANTSSVVIGKAYVVAANRRVERNRFGVSSNPAHTLHEAAQSREFAIVYQREGTKHLESQIGIVEPGDTLRCSRK